MSQALSGWGYEVSQAADGVEAQERINQELPDLIIMDILMPRLSGLEFIKWFRLQKLSSFVPVLLVTALDDLEHRVRGLNLGAEDYLTKPFQLSELAARVKVLLRTRQLTEDLKQRNQDLQQLQAELVRKERELAVLQLAGAAAHRLRQPLTTLLLSCYEIEGLVTALPPTSQVQARAALEQIKHESSEVNQLLENLTRADQSLLEEYLPGVAILKIDSVDKQSK